MTFLLLVLLTGWWTVLISRLLQDNYVLEVAFRGETPELVAEFQRRRFMLLGETVSLSLLALSLVGLAYRYSMAERAQIRRMEGLLAASTHELKTPVAGVRALLESIQSGVLPPDRMGPHVAHGLASVARLEHLIEGILAYQSAVARPRQQVRALPLGEVVEEVVEHRLREAPGEGVRVEVRDEVDALMDDDGVRVILENLLDNARKYGGAREVRVVCRAEGGVALVDVIDQGEGFVAEDAELMFEPYERGTAGQRRHGTGLGLYIGRTLARAMGGELTARSPGPGLGATFTLRLRRARTG